jgi:hypothetical protein
VAVHTERGDEVVSIEGDVVVVEQPGPELGRRLSEAYAKYKDKYGYAPESTAWDEQGIFAVTPQNVLAWKDFFKSATRWRFDRQA